MKYLGSIADPKDLVNKEYVDEGLILPYDETRFYSVGDYCRRSSNVYECIEPILEPELWTASHWAQVRIGQELNKTNHINDYELSLFYNGVLTITQELLEYGQWSYSQKAFPTTGDRLSRLRTQFLIPVKPGMQINYVNYNCDIFFGVLKSKFGYGTDAYWPGQSGWKRDATGTFNITQEGYLTFVVAKHEDTTSAMNITDFDSEVTIYGNSVVQNIETINNLIQKIPVKRRNYISSNEAKWSWTGEICNFICENAVPSGGIANTILDRQDLPSYINPGDKCFINYKTSNSAVGLRVVFYDENGTAFPNPTVYDNTIITIPAYAKQWLIRLTVPGAHDAFEEPVIISVSNIYCLNNLQFILDNIS